MDVIQLSDATSPYPIHYHRAGEALWSLGTIAANDSAVITVDVSVASGLMSGDLIVTPIRVDAAGAVDDINLLDVTAIKN